MMQRWHNGKDVIVMDSGYSGNDRKSAIPVARFGELLNTTFAFLPRGQQHASHRLVEVMSSGAIPIFINMDRYVKPYDDLISWSECSLSLRTGDGNNYLNHKEKFMELMRATLTSVSAAHLHSMQTCVRQAYASLLSDRGVGNGLLLSVLRLLERQRTSFRACSHRVLGGECLTSRTSATRLLEATGAHTGGRGSPTASGGGYWSAKFYCQTQPPCNVTVGFDVPCLPCSRFDSLTCDGCIGGMRYKRTTRYPKVSWAQAVRSARRRSQNIRSIIPWSIG